MPLEKSDMCDICDLSNKLNFLVISNVNYTFCRNTCDTFMVLTNEDICVCFYVRYVCVPLCMPAYVRVRAE